jgi:hypothetical protein
MLLAELAPDVARNYEKALALNGVGVTNFVHSRSFLLCLTAASRSSS